MTTKQRRNPNIIAMKRLFMSLALIAGLAFGSVATAMQAPDTDQISAVDRTPAVKAIGGGLEISTPDDAPCHFYVYSITGQMVKSVVITGSAVVELPRGCYIIKCSSWSKKVVIK